MTFETLKNSIFLHIRWCGRELGCDVYSGSRWKTMFSQCFPMYSKAASNCGRKSPL